MRTALIILFALSSIINILALVFIEADTLVRFVTSYLVVISILGTFFSIYYKPVRI